MNNEASPPVEVEPVGYISEWNGDISDIGQYIFVDNKDETDDEHIWTPVYTSPPDTEAKLKRAVEALKDDSYAISFQSIGQYRMAILNLIGQK